MEGKEEGYVERDVECHKTEEFHTGQNGDKNEGKEEIQEKAENGLHAGLVAEGVEESVCDVLDMRREEERDMLD